MAIYKFYLAKIHKIILIINELKNIDFENNFKFSISHLILEKLI